MKNVLIAIIAAVSIFVPTIHAQALTKEDAFTYLWSTIYRPVYDTYETPYQDVAESRDSYRVITWGKRRGLLEDTQLFLPDDIASRQEIALWLLRTRNVDTIDMLTLERLDVYANAYTTLAQFIAGQQEVTMATLQQLVIDFDAELDREIHEISFYSEKFHGKGTAFGETFDMEALTAAHPSFPHNTIVKVTNTENEKFVLVRINDRGPFVEGRSMDLSLAAFTSITDRSSGVLRSVTIERLGDVELYPREQLEQQHPSLIKKEEIAVDNTSTVLPNEPEKATSKCSRFANYYRKRINKQVRFLRGVPHVLPLGKALTLRANQFFVVRSVTVDGVNKPIQEWVMPNQEVYSFTPDAVGDYVFKIGTGVFDAQEFTMTVENCL